MCLPGILSRNLKYLGLFSLLVCVVTWGLDILEYVYRCPFCQVQRTVIGILGLLMVIVQRIPIFVLRYLTLLFGAYGAHVAASQSFDNFRRLVHGTPIEPIYITLSTLAFIFITFQIFLLFSYNKNSHES